MSTLPHTPDDKPPTWEPREIPEAAARFMASLRRRGRLATEPMSGGSYAERHYAETGHPFERGCCTLPANRCAGCRDLLPLAAKVNGERYCTRACREQHTDA